VSEGRVVHHVAGVAVAYREAFSFGGGSGDGVFTKGLHACFDDLLCIVELDVSVEVLGMSTT